jgi:hypothetical protein
VAPLFNIAEPMCDESVALYETKQWLAECSAAHSLVEATGTDSEKKAKTLTKIIIGPHHGPWDGEQYSLQEIKNRHVEFQLYVPEQSGKIVIATGLEIDHNGEIVWTTRRCVRDSEIDREDVYLFCVDRISALEHQLLSWFEVGRNRPRLNSITRQQGPSFSVRTVETEQGVYIYTVHTIGWGDQIGGGD